MKILDLIMEMVGSPVQRLYHFTTEDNALKIMAQDTLLAKPSNEYYLVLDKRLAKTKHKSAVSMTRDKMMDPRGLNLANPDHIDFDDNPQEEVDRLNITFILDGDKLKQRYKIEPFNYDALDKYHGIPVTKNREAEERVMTDKIQNLHKYIINIEYRGGNPKIKQAIDEYEEVIQRRKKEEAQKNITRF